MGNSLEGARCAVWEDDGGGGHKMVHLFEALKAVDEVTLALTRRVAVPHMTISLATRSRGVAWVRIPPCAFHFEGFLTTLPAKIHVE